MTHHTTTIDERDSAGHWGWHCLGCTEARSGYEEADEVLAAAGEHGPLAADSIRPTDDDEE